MYEFQQKLFCIWLNKAERKYQKKLHRQSKRNLIEQAFEIDVRGCIYEILLGLAEELSEEELQRINQNPFVFDDMYEAYLCYESKREAEIEDCIRKALGLEQEEINHGEMDNDSRAIEKGVAEAPQDGINRNRCGLGSGLESLFQSYGGISGQDNE